MSPSEEKNTFEELVAKNHREHGLFMEHDYHNHAVHLLGSLYDLGASAERMREMYRKLETRYLYKLPEPKYQVNRDNYREFVGKNDAYRDLVDFFEKEVGKLGFDGAFNRYVPSLLPGLCGHLVHPLIHLGYAVEFNNDLVLAEALAFGTLAYDAHGELIDKVLPTATSTDPVKIIEEVSKDTHYEDVDKGPAAESKFTRAIDAKHLEYTQKYFAAWDANFPGDDYAAKVYELSQAITLLFLGYSSSYRLNFFLCHVMTGFHAVRVLLPRLAKNDQVRALRLIWLTALFMYVAEGHPKPEWNEVNGYSIDRLPKDRNKAWEEVTKAAINDEDIHGHVVKSVRAMKELAKVYPEGESTWLHGCAKVTDLVKTEGDWGHDGALEKNTSK
ncbi:hypothetical protein K493DRAFT_360857 [Basidiobolus meristosporus CBS 931.73]|uniref:Questin oxidase n=1 Tax=Basidiobolus meristosporus CBS 931.73 TaxID=1314790 RepID=A0A1Y1XE73_9FUNG|nr:hypothetical protein K493DRAFT_360857 [Basidiobolus meristosporus CBS 931.73]|eukprot:ORX84007.1 hypothetical protein K493DRAFT_360857 [Basidiobolus meristosporus CBS 931.73]